MSTFTNKKLIKPILIPITSTLVYTVPSGISTILTVITVSNTTLGTLHFDIHLCDQNDVASDSNALLSNAELLSHETANFNFGQVLSTGDKIRAYADGSGISLHLSGIEIL